MLNLGHPAFEQAIKSIGLYKGKAKNIYQTSELLLAKKGKIPKTASELIKLPGVWEKTAKVVLHVLYKKPVIAVDTHVHRICNRLGIVQTKTPLQTSKLLETVIPNKYKQIAHHCIILFLKVLLHSKEPKMLWMSASKSFAFTLIGKIMFKNSNDWTSSRVWDFYSVSLNSENAIHDLETSTLLVLIFSFLYIQFS